MIAITIRDKAGATRQVELDKRQITIGREADNDVVLESQNVSKHHARIEMTPDGVFIVDLGSTNGTYLSSRKITEPSRYFAGDVLHIGDYALTVALAAPRIPGGSLVGHPKSPDSNPVDPVAQGHRDLDAAFSRLDPGWLAVDAPRTALLGAHVKIKVIAIRSDLVKLVLEEVEHHSPQLKQARLGNMMRADLRADENDAFLIEPLSSPEQPVLTEETTCWEWIVTPRHAGLAQTLRVTVTNLIDVAGRTIPKSLPSRSFTLDVRMDVPSAPLASLLQPFTGRPLTFFCCYSPADQPFREELEKHLALLKRQRALLLVHDRAVTPGANREAEIDSYIDNADVVLLLVSADFLASDICYLAQMTRALERHRQSRALVLPILIRPVDIGGAPFAHLPHLPRSGPPISLWPQRDEAWLQVSTELRVLIEHLTSAEETRKAACLPSASL